MNVHNTSQDMDICIRILYQNADIFSGYFFNFWTTADMKITLQICKHRFYSRKCDEINRAVIFSVSKPMQRSNISEPHRL